MPESLSPNTVLAAIVERARSVAPRQKSLFPIVATSTLFAGVQKRELRTEQPWEKAMPP
jgi:hypothetical protein